MMESKESPKLISKQELSALKIKLVKRHRSQKDWNIINELLLNHDLIVPESLDEDYNIEMIHGAMCLDGAFIAFTNMVDCSSVMKFFFEDKMGPLRWQMNFKSFVDMAHIADAAGCSLYIDPILDGKNRFISYSQGHVEANIAVPD